MSRAKRPYGFEFWEVWADALGWEDSARRDSAFWLYRHLIKGVRMMVKFEDFEEQGFWYEELLRRREVARGLGLKVMLCIDWFNRASERQGYHATVNRPPIRQIPGQVATMLSDFDPNILEVCNEPYYAKRMVDRVTIAEYNPFVGAYLDGASRANFRGEVVASQSDKNFFRKNPSKIEDGWEWDYDWQYGLIEGKHSAVLHRHTTFAELTEAVGGWHNGKPIGWQFPIFETECSVTGLEVDDNTQQGEILCRDFTDWCQVKKLPYAYLIMGGDEGGGSWGLKTRLVDGNGAFTRACKGIADAMNISLPDNPSQPPDPPPGDAYPGAKWAYKAIQRADALEGLDEALSDRKFNRYLKKWHANWRE